MRSACKPFLDVVVVGDTRVVGSGEGSRERFAETPCPQGAATTPGHAAVIESTA